MKKNIEKVKVILLGEAGVGKTNLINISIGLPFNEDETPTYSSSFVDKVFEINNKKYKLQLWDTIGQEKYRHLTKLFFKDSKIVILVYDKSSKNTFDKVSFWYKEVNEILGDEPLLAIVANKSDLEEKQEDVDESVAREYANKINAKFRLVSAKSNKKGFESFLRELLIDYIKNNGGKVDENDDRIKLNNSKNKKKEKKPFIRC